MNIKKISMLLTGSACALCLISQDGMGTSKYAKYAEKPVLLDKYKQAVILPKETFEQQNKNTLGGQTQNTEEFVLPTNANEVAALFQKAIPEDQRENVRKALDEFYKDDNDDQGKILLAESLEGDKDALNGYLSCFDKNLAAKIRDRVALNKVTSVEELNNVIKDWDLAKVKAYESNLKQIIKDKKIAKDQIKCTHTEAQDFLKGLVEENPEPIPTNKNERDVPDGFLESL